MLWDTHMHCSYSGDSDAAPEDMIQAAIGKDLAGLCFTDHLDLDFPGKDQDLFLLPILPRAQHLRLLAEKWRGKVQVCCGIELGLQPHLASRHASLLSEHDFDFVIGSSHLAHGVDPYYPEYYQGRSEEAAYREYFTSILENIRAFDGFDVYGHLDYVVRYGPNKNKHYSYGKYWDIIDDILRELVARGKGIELNTGGFRAGLGQPNPCQEILARYRALGGEVVTLGSDAHRPEHVAYEFNRASSILKEAGFSYVTLFRGRKPEFLRL